MREIDDSCRLEIVLAGSFSQIEWNAAKFRDVPGGDYATLWFTLASAKQRPGTSIGGLQSVLNFGVGVICAGTCTGALSLTWGFACLIGNLSLLIERWAIC
jgi:hypothetical protein